MQTWLARLLNQPVAQGAVAEVQRRMEGGFVYREKMERFVCYFYASVYVVHIYVAASVYQQLC